MGKLDPRRAKLHHSYTVAEVARLYFVHRNTVRNWLKAGLPAIGSGRSLLILGRDLGQFLRERQEKRRRQKCGPGELFCLRCQVPRLPRSGAVRLPEAQGPTVNVAAECANCGAEVHRRVSLKKLAASGFATPTPGAG